MSECNHHIIISNGFKVCENCGLTFDRDYEVLNCDDSVIMDAKIIDDRTQLNLTYMDKQRFPKMLHLQHYKMAKKGTIQTFKATHTLKQILAAFDYPKTMFGKLLLLMRKIKFKNTIENWIACLLYESQNNHEIFNLKGVLNTIKETYKRFNYHTSQLALMELKRQFPLRQINYRDYIDTALQQIQTFGHLPMEFIQIAKNFAYKMYDGILKLTHVNSHKRLIYRIVWDLGRYYASIHKLPEINQIKFSMSVLGREFAIKDYHKFTSLEEILPLMMDAKEAFSLLINK